MSLVRFFEIGFASSSFEVSYRGRLELGLSRQFNLSEAGHFSNPL